MPVLHAVDGPPGSGKTTTIIREAQSWTEDTQAAVVTYTTDAAGVLKQRAPNILSGTIYSLTWPYAKKFLKGRLASRGNAIYGTRKIAHALDPALEQYCADAPSRNKQIAEEIARELHGWEGGHCPFDLSTLTPKGQIQFLLPIAKWLEAGAPIPDEDRLDFLAIDEAQDMSALEIRAAMALLKPEGKAVAYGDPGQAIFGTAKGLRGNQLPAAWRWAESTQVLSKGWRVGNPVSSLAAKVLDPYYSRPSSTFTAEHSTELIAWDTPHVRPARGLCLGFSRRLVARNFRNWGLTGTSVTPKLGRADTELVLSTCHAAKGAEAKEVFILPFSRFGLEKIEASDPAMLRLLYVALTRASKRLYIPRNLLGRIRR